MSFTHPSRRGVLAASAALGLAGAARKQDRLIEPVMRLARSARGAPTVAITFDACPGAFDHRIADALVALSIPATIFVTGRWMRLNPAGLAFLLARPDIFNLENHGELHIPPVLGQRRVFGIPVAGDLEVIRREVVRGGADIEAASGRAPRWYRAATGLYSPLAMPLIRRLDYGIAGYSVNADMGASLPPPSVARRIAGAGDRDVVVAHINQPHRASGEGVVEGLRALRERRVQFARLDHLTSEDVLYG